MRKNGFTLIELLAVIVLLAIIALIATPIILGIINDAREESRERSVELYVAAVKNSMAFSLLNGEDILTDGSYEIVGGELCLDINCLQTKKIDVEGVVPQNGWIAIEGGNIIWYDLEFDGKNYPMFPYTEDEYISYLYNQGYNLMYTELELNEYYQIKDYDACVNYLTTDFCNSAGQAITINFAGSADWVDDLLKNGIIEEIKEFPKDKIGDFDGPNSIIALPVGVKQIESWSNITNKTVIIPNTVISASFIQTAVGKLIIPNSVKTLYLAGTSLEKLVVPSSVTYISLEYGNDSLTNIIIKNKKENVDIEDINGYWSDGSGCASPTGNIKDSPCITWEE